MFALSSFRSCVTWEHMGCVLNSGAMVAAKKGYLWICTNTGISGFRRAGARLTPGAVISDCLRV